MRRRYPLHTSAPTGFGKFLVVDKVGVRGGRCQSPSLQDEPAAGRIWGSASIDPLDPPPNLIDTAPLRAFAQVERILNSLGNPVIISLVKS